MITALELRSLLGKILEGQIGTYTFVNGATAEAITVLPDPDKGYNYPPSGTAVAGLELIIQQPYPEAALLLASGISSTQKWQIILKQWDSNSNLITATHTLMTELSYPILKIVPVLPNEKYLTIEQVRVEIVDYLAFLPD